MALLTTLGSGAAAQSIVGQWDCNGRSGPKEAVRTLQEYKSSGRLYHLANMAIGNGGQRVDAAILLRGTWSAKGNILIEKFSTAKVRSLTFNGKDVSNTPAGSHLKNTLRSRFLSKTYRTRLRTLSGDRMAFKSNRIDATCTRR